MSEFSDRWQKNDSTVVKLDPDDASTHVEFSNGASLNITYTNHHIPLQGKDLLSDTTHFFCESGAQPPKNSGPTSLIQLDHYKDLIAAAAQRGVLNIVLEPCVVERLNGQIHDLSITSVETAIGGLALKDVFKKIIERWRASKEVSAVSNTNSLEQESVSTTSRELTRRDMLKLLGGTFLASSVATHFPGYFGTSPIQRSAVSQSQRAHPEHFVFTSTIREAVWAAKIRSFIASVPNPREISIQSFVGINHSSLERYLMMSDSQLLEFIEWLYMYALQFSKILGPDLTGSDVDWSSIASMKVWQPSSSLGKSWRGFSYGDLIDVELGKMVMRHDPPILQTDVNFIAFMEKLNKDNIHSDKMIAMNDKL